MSTNIFKPSGSGLRMPTDPKQMNGDIVNPPRYAEWGGLSGPDKIKTTVNHSKFDLGNPFRISKPGSR